MKKPHIRPKPGKPLTTKSKKATAKAESTLKKALK